MKLDSAAEGSETSLCFERDEDCLGFATTGHVRVSNRDGILSFGPIAWAPKANPPTIWWSRWSPKWFSSSDSSTPREVSYVSTSFLGCMNSFLISASTPSMPLLRMSASYVSWLLSMLYWCVGVTVPTEPTLLSFKAEKLAWTSLSARSVEIGVFCFCK